MKPRLIRVWFLFFLFGAELSWSLYETFMVFNMNDNSTFYSSVVTFGSIGVSSLICLYAVYRLFMFKSNVIQWFLFGMSVWVIDYLYQHSVDSSWNGTNFALFVIGLLLSYYLYYLVRSAELWNQTRLRKGTGRVNIQRN